MQSVLTAFLCGFWAFLKNSIWLKNSRCTHRFDRTWTGDTVKIKYKINSKNANVQNRCNVYQAIITAPASKRVLDILPCRSQAELIAYLKQWNTKERKRVKYFVSDIWQPYSDIASAFFKNSVQIVDRYHFIRQMVWAFEKVRKRIQKQYGKECRLLFRLFVNSWGKMQNVYVVGYEQ